MNPHHCWTVVGFGNLVDQIHLRSRGQIQFLTSSNPSTSSVCPSFQKVRKVVLGSKYLLSGGLRAAGSHCDGRHSCPPSPCAVHPLWAWGSALLFKSPVHFCFKVLFKVLLSDVIFAGFSALVELLGPKVPGGSHASPQALNSWMVGFSCSGLRSLLCRWCQSLTCAFFFSSGTKQSTS